MQKYYQGKKENHKQKGEKKNSRKLQYQAMKNYGILHEVK